MSINFENETTKQQQDFIRKMFGEENITAQDAKTTLIRRMRDIRQPEMKMLANETKQCVQVEINSEGDIKTLSDGTQYRLEKDGWKKMTPLPDKGE